MSSFGVGPSGFTPMRLSDCRADLNAGIASAFGNNVSLGDSTVFGQLSGVLSERFALLWESLQDVYNSQYPSGAEGVSVDNILSLNGLFRLPARASVTNPTPNVESNGLVDYGLVLYGTPGTVIPAGSIIQTSTLPVQNFTLDNDVTLGTAVSAQQTLQLSAQPTAGSYVLTLVTPSGASVSTPAISYAASPQQTLVSFAQAPSTGSYSLTFSGVTTATTAQVAFNATPAQVQTAIQKVSPYNFVTVSGSATSYAINWTTGPIPLISVVGAGLDATPTVTQATQGLINAIIDPGTQSLPFTDVSFSPLGNTAFTLAFGAFVGASGQPSSANSQQALATVGNNALQAGNAICNIGVSTSVAGRAAQGLGTATCTVTGAIFVAANTLNVIGSGRTGWASVNNDLDVIAGADLETDEQALARRESLLASRGSGATPAIVDNILALTNVTACIAFPNLTNAAVQVITFQNTPQSGSYSLSFQGTPTASLAYNAAATDVQNALQALPGLSQALVTGSAAFGFSVNFNGAMGGQAVPLLGVANNSTGVSIAPYFGRPPHSVELVVEGGSDAEVAKSILNALPAGIASFGQPILRTTGSCVAGSTSVNLASVVNVAAGQAISGQGLATGTTIVSLTGNTATVSIAALGTYSSVPMIVSTTILVRDDNQNAHLINFSRPQSIPVYVKVALVTDYYQVPGNPNSGLNPSANFSPASAAQIQTEILAIGNSIPIGGTIVARGTNGLVGSFQNIAGILDYQLFFDTVSPPTNQANILLPSEGLASFQSFNILVSFV